ncbi:MAG: acyl carrier protein [Clostridia bacterium]|nr:acyl carrier protein [Clostridia bacterium]
MDRLIEILEDIKPDVDYATCETLIDSHILESLDIISLIAELEEEYGVTIPAIEIVPENFNSAQRIKKMIERLEEEY